MEMTEHKCAANGDYHDNCVRCEWYNTLERGCECEDIMMCAWTGRSFQDRFEKKPDCEHRFEKCDENCEQHCRPSSTHCGFTYACNLDSRCCDLRCSEHLDRQLCANRDAAISALHELKWAGRGIVSNALLLEVELEISKLESIVKKFREEAKKNGKD